MGIVEFKIYCKKCGTHICDGMIYKTVKGGYLCEYCFDGVINDSEKEE